MTMREMRPNGATDKHRSAVYGRSIRRDTPLNATSAVRGVRSPIVQTARTECLSLITRRPAFQSPEERFAR